MKQNVTQKQKDELFSLHFNKLLSRYGNIIAVNLIDKKNDQLKIGKAYEEAFTQQQNDCLMIFMVSNKTVDYVNSFYWFDFHAECKGMHFENIEKLVKRTKKDVEEGLYFHFDLVHEKVLQLQYSFIRTNCIDCLDRMWVYCLFYEEFHLLS